MSDQPTVRRGMEVFGSDNQRLGTIEAVHIEAVDVAGQHIDGRMIDRSEGNCLYLNVPAARYLRTTNGQASARTVTTTTREDRTLAGMETRAGEIRIPVEEERLRVEKHEGELGEVALHKTVVEEQVSIPVELTREEVHVERVHVADRPIGPEDRVFEEGRIRVPVRGEEAVVEKLAVITGELVVNKERITEPHTVSDTVRKSRVEVNEHYQRVRPALQQHFTQRQRTTGGRPPRTFEEVESHYRTGFEAGSDERYAGRRFEEVEPDLRRDHETRGTGRTASWDQLREELREGFNRAHSR